MLQGYEFVIFHLSFLFAVSVNLQPFNDSQKYDFSLRILMIGTTSGIMSFDSLNLSYEYSWNLVISFVR